jgi:hypothetical protein
MKSLASRHRLFHDSLPYGRPRDTECRNRLRSPAESGSLTRSSQCLSRTGTSPLHNSRSRRCHLGKLDHFQLKMVGHQAITKTIYPDTRAGVGHRLHESVVITGLVEHRLSPVAPIQYVIPHASNRDTRGSWDATNVKHHRAAIPIKRYVPLFRPEDRGDVGPEYPCTIRGG